MIYTISSNDYCFEEAFMIVGNAVLYALAGTTFTFLATAAGAAMVFFFKNDVKADFQRIFLGFAAGVMIAASVWSLLIPAIEMSEAAGQIAIIPAALGFVAGGLFLLLLDSLIPHLHMGSSTAEGMPSHLRRTTMLVFAVTLHNIPEGMAVGLAFAVASQNGTLADGAFAGAIALAIGMGLQNFPEGAAISLPLKKEGLSNGKSFLYGALSGIVEPIAGVLTVFVASAVAGILPWILSFAAGAMIYVVVEELIPEAQMGDHSNLGTIGVMGGFLIMMILDVTLG